MDLILYVLKAMALTLTYALSTCLLIRLILSFLSFEENGFTEFFTMVTEPVIQPFRTLFWKLNWFQDTPIDVAYLCAAITISVISTLLSF